MEGNESGMERGKGGRGGGWKEDLVYTSTHWLSRDVMLIVMLECVRHRGTAYVLCTGWCVCVCGGGGGGGDTIVDFSLQEHPGHCLGVDREGVAER